MARIPARARAALPRSMSRAATVAASRKALGKRRRKITRNEDIFRIATLGLDWDIGVMVYTPASGQITTGADGTYGVMGLP